MSFPDIKNGKERENKSC